MSNQLAVSQGAQTALISAVSQAAQTALLPVGIEKSLQIVMGMNQLEQALGAAEIANVLMKMQNNANGFLTDKQGAGYPKDTVIQCAIDAASKGLMFTGNEWNIIAGRCYPAKAGFERMLREHCQLHRVKHSLVKEVPVFVKADGKQAIYEAVVHIYWQTEGGEKQVQKEKYHLKGMTTDQVQGKAVKRATQWLYNELTNNSFGLAPDDEDAIPTTATAAAPAEPVEKVDAAKVTAHAASLGVDADSLAWIANAMGFENLADIPNDEAHRQELNAAIKGAADAKKAAEADNFHPPVKN